MKKESHYDDTYHHSERVKVKDKIVFLHGLAGSNQGFFRLPCLAPILPGHQGVSLTGCQNLRDIADYVFEETKLQKIKKPVIVGFSLF